MKILNKYKVLVLIALVLGMVMQFFAKPYKISGDCMEPAIRDGKLYFLNRTLPFFRPYRIGDIVFFDRDGHTWISRIVALEGHTIQIQDHKIFVNGTDLTDGIQRNWSDWKYGTYAVAQLFQVPIRHVYMLSDNLSAHHDDSRVFGAIATNSIIGVVW